MKRLIKVPEASEYKDVEFRDNGMVSLLTLELFTGLRRSTSKVG